MTASLLSDVRPSPARLPTPLGVDPWWDVFLPAWYGEVEAAREALATLLTLDPDLLGDAAAVGVRALFLMRDPAGAWRLWERARGAPGREVAALRVFLEGAEREAPGEEGAADGDLAEARLDRAAVCLVAGEVRSAARWVAAARRACPDHLEGERWERFLAEGEGVVVAARDARWRRGGPVPAAVDRDADALVPLRSRGHLSEERLRRRLLGVGSAPRARGAGPGGALRRLVHAGVQELRFGWEHVYRRLGAEDPRVGLELGAERAVARVAEGRPAGEQVASLWAEAGLVGEEAMLDAARVIVPLALRAPSLAGAARAPLKALRAAPGVDLGPWEVATRLLDEAAHPRRALRLARACAADPTQSPETWHIALAALEGQGAVEEARARRQLLLPTMRGLPRPRAGALR